MYMIQCTSVLFRLHDVICMQAAFYPVFCDFVMGPIQVLRNADGGGGGCLIFWKKALRRCNVQCY